MVKVRKPSENEAKRIYYYIFILVCIVAFVAVQEGMFGFDVYEIFGSEEASARYEWNESISSIWRATATFGNSLVFSSSMIMCIPIVEYYRLHSEKPSLAYFMLAIIAIAILLSGSRSGTIGCIIYFVYLLIKNKKGRIAGLVIIIASFILIYSFIDLETIISRFSTNGLTSAHRSYAYSMFFDVFLKYPFWGTGLGNSYSVLTEYISESFVTNTMDNAFLDGALSLGIWGITALIIAFDSIKKHVSLNGQKIGIVVICFIYISFFLNTTKYQSLWGMLWFYIAMASYEIPIEESDVAN